MDFKKIVVAGSGVLGSQIAFQTAFKGFQVTVYDVNDQAILSGKRKILDLKEKYLEEIRHAENQYEKMALRITYNKNLLPNLKEMLECQIDKELQFASSVPDSIKYATDLKDAVKDADLVIEAIPERADIKLNFYSQLGEVAPEKTIFATNSSTLLPSTFAEYTGRPENFLSLHFANEIWRNNTAEVMGHDKTDQHVYDQIVEFAKAIGMVPLELKKEQPGYILNSILVPFLEASQSLLLNGVADVETIDKTWKLATGAPAGPFQILDVVGIQTAYNILKNYADTTNNKNSEHARLAAMLKSEYLDKGKTGLAAGEGFYKYN